MDNSAYVPNHLPPPSLVVFSQAGGLPEALRMQRPFNPQVTDSKDLQVPFSTAASLGYGLHHMLHLPPQFLHPLDHRLPFGGFRPLGPSAFAPPSKCLKVETGNGPVTGSGLPSIGSLSSMSNMFSPSSLSSASGGAVVSVSGASASIGGVGGVGGVGGGASAAAAQEVAPQSPAGSTSRSPTGTGTGSVPNRGTTPEDEDRDANATPGSENTERSTPEEGRPYRLGPVFGGRCGAEALGLGLGLSLGPAYRFALPPGLAAKTTRCLVFDQGKKKFPSDPSCCPACGVTVRPQELEQHFAQELDRLYKISSASSRARASRSSLPPGHPQDHPHGPMLHAPSAADGTPHGRWETYKRIKANRQARIRVKNRKRKADEPSCPVCSERLSGTPEELNQHVERCLNKHNNGNPAGQNNLDEEEVDVEGDAETFEEYEWAGQRRVRATSMLVGGFSAAGLATSSSNRSTAGNGGSNQQEEEDVDLVVDGDDAAEFGPAQYSEADVIAPRMDGTPREQKERDALREAVISPNASNTPHTPHTPEQIGQGLVEVKPEPGTATPLGQNEQDESASTSPRRDGDTPVIEALRGRIRELEAEMRGQPFKCLICMEQYKKPVTSVCCWHVHCEQCWLHTLGAKKLCPQCNMITSPSDLRRIYM
ncbi:E3 ubiquitin-protein ligase Rnf220-like isoform X2 [Bombus vosnesenskii]|nr:E3 ubiquitin-protein ligase Rnf220-like isoform X2 [Bombus impatiens]XP_024226229.1 E3 ubiquitin-protein ligase Rnf220-like isoform X2 [Bombus impatiens]XP_033186970.1 E3 ubiquitin-protein ligase Rnf220-like isoform X2 [Bombus vancouverensis nearcticus]XP_033186971.1 E3 ubiquitin-protein ligase Rnf220-like isoform X2 [Bombus vancouverensis nearcticus]XP_033347436.1 E3 ubiquitin-protein ligase Rnf220-like isoform X2 [Bombus vosnesenskii]XP_033347446.1 E3 ubiquitin-protein ligase Rnf220-like 